MSNGGFFNTTWKKIATTISALMVIGGFIGGWVWVDSYFAHADEPKKNRIMIQKHIVKDDIRWYQDQQTYIRSKYGVNRPEDLPSHAYDQYEYYEREKKALEEELKNLIRKQ
jgi:hypothetical protein